MLARLPDPVPPAQHEIAASYIGRLATIHGLDINALWRRVTEREASGGMRRVVVPERLAAVTGRTVHALAGALPELRTPQPDWVMFRHQPQPGCHHCDSKHPGGRVTRLLPHHRYVCTRHSVWIGPPDADQPSVSLAGLPEIIGAQRKHLRILRQHGWAATYDALLTAFTFCGHIWTGKEPPENPHHVWHTWDERAHVLIPPETVKKSYSTSRLFAAVYPEAVSVAALLASPHWRRLASGTATERETFYGEISKRIDYPYRSNHDHSDAIAHWADTDAWRPPSNPLVTFRPGRTQGRLPERHRGHGQRQEKSALWFSRTRRNAGRNLLFHNHLKPVLTRAWTPAYEKFEGVIWHSARVDEQMITSTATERKELGGDTAATVGGSQEKLPPSLSADSC
ncbi:TniQ family protein [Streptomyces purpureus]|uniref:TniQ family protein n=1 Tax=Streptomyces purpureus TaxID=1951 RepID=UPI0003605C97|nr:TniQ family protein [Streptomyces purpureus]